LTSWYQLSVRVPISDSEHFSGFLFDLGSSGLEVDDTSSPNTVTLTAYFPEIVERSGVVSAVSEESAGIEGAVVLDSASDVPDEDWGAKWREHFVPIYPTARMVIHPPWIPVESPENGFTLAIEPKTAFGTGSHPTTKMALIALERVIRGGERVLDVGTGSGILSIAAMHLGAGSVLAVDTDPLATENVAENVALNAVSGIQNETREVTGLDIGFHVTVANIIRSTLTPLLPLLRGSVALRGHVILGGLLEKEESQFRAAVEGAGLSILEVTREAEWIGLITRVES
jgi:ribosomal protein L11 methyltransferase